MKKLPSLLLITFCLPLLLFSSDYRGTLSLENMVPAAGKDGPDVASMTIKWALDDNEGQPQASFHLQWYLGTRYHYKGKTYNMRDLAAVKELISIRSLVMEADVISEGQRLGILRFDMGATPPHGGLWGDAVSFRFEWEDFLKRRFNSLDEKNAWLQRLQQAFEEGIVLEKLQIYELDFGGLQFVEEEIQFREKQAVFAEMEKEADKAFSAANYSLAIELYQKAWDANPTADGLKEKMDLAYYASHLAEGDILFDKKEYEAALKSYQAAEALGLSEATHKEKMALAEKEIAMRNKVQQLWQQLQDQYNEKAHTAGEYAQDALLKAVLAEDESLENCYLANRDFYSCEEAFFNQKKANAEAEARFEVYGDPLDKTASVLEKSCEKPPCSLSGKLTPDSLKTAVFHLEIAKRKFRRYEELEKQEAFLQEGREQLSLALSLDSTLAGAYLLKAYLATDVIEQLAEVDKALAYNPKLKEALDEKVSLQTAFVKELGRKISNGDVSYIQRAQQNNLLKNEMLLDGKTPAEFALHHDQAQVLAILLKPELRVKNAGKITREQALLEMAAAENKIKSATFLLSQGANPAQLGESGKSPLLIATEKESMEVLRMFLEQKTGMDLDAALLFSTEKGSAKLLNTFLDVGANVAVADAMGDNLLMMAIRLGHNHLIDDLLEKGADVNHANGEGMTPLAYAAEKQANSIIQKLLSYKAQIEPSLKILASKKDSSISFLCEQALIFCMEKGEGSQLPLLIQYDADLALAKHPMGSPFIFHALALGHEKIATQLLDANGNFSDPIEGKYLLLEAIEAGADTLVGKLLEEKKVSMEVRTGSSESPLHLAVHHNFRSIVVLLLANGHSLDPLDRNGRTPMHMALLEGRKELSAMLIGAGADLSLKDNKGWQPVHMAAYANDLNHLGLLIEKGADVNARGESGMTPLHYAAQNADLAMIEYLLAAGADKTIEDFFGRTPYKIARKANQRELAKWLK